jgi:hypothetical protein
MLAIVGVWLFTVTLTTIFWDLEVTAAPEATTVILAVYGVAVGASDVASTFTVIVAISPGKTIPTAGETVIHVAPEVTVYEIGAPLVDKVIVWDTDGSGGARKARVAGLKLKVDGAAVTLRFTAITAGDATPVTVIVTDDA